MKYKSLEKDMDELVKSWPIYDLKVAPLGITVSNEQGSRMEIP